MKAGHIHFIHIRKTGGTFFNKSILSSICANYDDLYSKACTPPHVVECEGKICIGWRTDFLSNLPILYSFSHNPFWTLKYDEKVTYITIFRDPVKRLVSHYKMLLFLNEVNKNRADFDKNKYLTWDSFDEFIQFVPLWHLQHQLYMFSKDFDISEAMHNVDKLDHFSFTDSIIGFTRLISAKYNIKIQSIERQLVSHVKFNPSAKHTEKLTHLMREEIQFINYVKKIYSKSEKYFNVID